MSEAARNRLRQFLQSGYQDLMRGLTRRLGSADLAGDVLHDAYLRIETADLTNIENPRAYLYRAALNAANDRRRAESRRLTTEELDELFVLEAADPSPEPAQVCEAQSDLESLQRALHTLSARRRDIFEESFLREIPHAQLAERYGISVRMVQMELKAAVEHCALHLRLDAQPLFRKKYFATGTPGASLRIEAVHSGAFARSRKRP
jgi:RNA polymerase sigma-70 factor (ECF subfamily)